MSTYPKESSTRPRNIRQQERRPEGPIQHVLSGSCDLAHRDQSVLRFSSSHPKLQTRIAARHAVTGPVGFSGQWVCNDVVEGCRLAVWTPCSRSSDAVVLRQPGVIQSQVSEVQEIGLEDVGERGRGGIDAVSAFAIRTD